LFPITVLQLLVTLFRICSYCARIRTSLFNSETQTHTHKPRNRRGKGGNCPLTFSSGGGKQRVLMLCITLY